MKKSVSIIFEEKPEQWGFRGDPYLWEELQHLFNAVELPCPESCFIHHFEKFFQDLTDRPLKTEAPFVVEKYAHGGMSSGGISTEFWRVIALPLLITRLQKINKER
jgi:hypothetical protein